MEALKLKTLLSLLIMAAGAITVPFFISESAVSEQQASGLLIDFKQWDVTWAEMDMEKNSDPYDALDVACIENDYTFTIEDGTVTEINGISSDDSYSWDLWTISKNSTTWVKQINPQNVALIDYTIACWAYREDGGVPTVAVDISGKPIFGYKTAQRIVTLSPALTEIVGAVRAIEALVGTDSYSDYPYTVAMGQKDGKIKTVGGYTTPNYEAIVSLRPDVVFCDGSLYAHYLVAERLRNISVNAILMYGGESIQTILSNIYMMGVVVGYTIRSAQALEALENAVNDITNTIYSDPQAREVDVMLALSTDKSPWVTGTGTYIDDLSSFVMGNNVFSSQYDWVQINSEQIPVCNPSVIIVYTPEYAATQEEYDIMMKQLSAEWKATDAYKNGEIYLVCGSAGDMALNPSPRFAQLMEITARILHPGTFGGEEMPKYIGGDYRDYLTFTKDINFDY